MYIACLPFYPLVCNTSTYSLRQQLQLTLNSIIASTLKIQPIMSVLYITYCLYLQRLLLYMLVV